MKWPSVQISVVVAANQARNIIQSGRHPMSALVGIALRTVVGKGSLRVALMQRLVGPKWQEKSSLYFVMKTTKGNRVNFPNFRLYERCVMRTRL
jgi:hypothetical protein